jgi:hypothetical protein
MARRLVPFAVAAYLLIVFADRFLLLELLFRRVGIPLLLAVVAAMACIGAGFLARNRKRGIAMNLAIGYPIFGTICFLVGLISISPWTMVPLLVIFAAVGVLASLPDRSIPFDSLSRNWIPVAVVAVAGFLIAQAPPHSLDELAYHLAIPWAWAKEGRAIELPLISHSYFPLGVESADLPFFAVLGIDGGVASHFLHLLVALAAVFLIFPADALIVMAIVTAPVLAVTTGWSLVDWNILAIALALMRAIDDDDRVSIAAAVAAGLLTKYTFIPFVAIAVWRARKPALIGMAGGSVFFLRNLLLTGNPIAPFFSRFAPHVAHYRAGAYLSDYVFDPHFIDESLGASLLGAAAATAGTVFWILLGIGAVLFLLAPSARILVPFFAVPASRATIAWKPFRVALAMAIAVQLLLIVFFIERSNVLGLIAGRDSDEDFLKKARTSYPTIAEVDQALPPDSRTLVIGLNETFWFRHRVRGGGNFDGPLMSAYLEGATPDSLRERLRKDGITHVAVIAPPGPHTAVAKKIEERQTALTPPAQRSLAQMLDRYAASVAQHGSAALFTLR